MTDREDSRRQLMVILRHSSPGDLKTSEGLRMAVGQSLSNRVTVVLAGATASLAAASSPQGPGGAECEKHLSMLVRLRQRVLVEAESLEPGDPDASRLREGVQAVAAPDIQDEMLAAHAVVVF